MAWIKPQIDNTDSLDFAANKRDYREVPCRLDGLRKACVIGRAVPSEGAQQDIFGWWLPGGARERCTEDARHLLPQLLGHAKHKRAAGKHIPDRVRGCSFGEAQLGFNQLARPPKQYRCGTVSHHLQTVVPGSFAQGAQPLKSFSCEFHEHLWRRSNFLDFHSVS